MNPRAAVLFDLDGTLVDTVPFILSCVRHTFAEYGTGPTDAEWTVGIGTPLALQLAQFARHPEDVPALFERYRGHWNAHHDAATKTFPGARETVEALAARGHPLAIVTAKSVHGAVRTLEHTGLLPFMGAVIGADSCARCKPHPDPVLLALERLGASPRGAVLLGDSSHDLAAARAAGVLALGAAWGVSTPDALRSAGASRVLTHIRELPGVLMEISHADAPAP